MRTDAEDTITLPLKETASATAKALRLKRFGVRRLTRAHLSLSRRPALAKEAKVGLEAVRGCLEKQLACAVSLSGRLLESAVSPFGGLARTSVFGLVELSAIGAKAVLELDAALVAAVLERLSGGEGRLSAASKLTRVEEAGFSYLCLLALSALRAEAGLERRFSPRLVSVHADRGEVLERLDCTLPYVSLEVSVAVGSAAGLVRVLLPAPQLQTAVQDAKEELPGQIAPEVLAASVEARVLAGRTRLDPTDFAHLAPGDVAMLEGLWQRHGALSGECRLLGRTFELRGQLGPGGFAFSRAVPRAYPQEWTMAQTEVEAKELPVEVEVELTRIRMTLSELSLLKPGAVLPLHMNAAEPVVLRVGDRSVARAELVEVEGEVGARVIALLP